MWYKGVSLWCNGEEVGGQVYSEFSLDVSWLNIPI